MHKYFIGSYTSAATSIITLAVVLLLFNGCKKKNVQERSRTVLPNAKTTQKMTNIQPTEKSITNSEKITDSGSYTPLKLQIKEVAKPDFSSLPVTKVRQQPPVPAGFKEIPFAETATKIVATSAEKKRGFIIFSRPILKNSKMLSVAYMVDDFDTDEDMPDIDTLDEHSDYSGFMSKKVSEALRKMALQKLFHGESYNIRDGLDEYDGDYTSFEKLDPSVITCDMRHLIEVEAEKMRLAKEEKEKEELLLAEKKADEVELAEQKQNSEDNLEEKVEVVNGEGKQDEIESMREEVAEIDLEDIDDVEGEEV